MRRSYSLYGLALESERAFDTPVPEASGAPEVAWTVEPSVNPSPPPDGAAKIPYRTHAGPAGLHVFRRDEAIVLRFETVAEFELLGNQVRCRPFRPVRETEIELTLLGPVLAVVSSLSGRLALHASAVVVAGTSPIAVGFLARSRGGKTSLACALLQCGAALLTDDVLVVDPTAATAYPAWPQIRLWPEEVRHFYGPAEPLPRVSASLEKRRVPIGLGGLGSFKSAPAKLACLYLPERRPTVTGASEAIDFCPVPRIEAAREILSNSFAARTLKALADSPRHLDSILELLQTTAVRRISFPDGLEQLPRVCQAIRDDVASAP